MADEHKPNGGNHGGVAVPDAVLVVKKNAKCAYFNYDTGGIRTGGRRRSERTEMIETH